MITCQSIQRVLNVSNQKHEIINVLYWNCLHSCDLGKRDLKDMVVGVLKHKGLRRDRNLQIATQPINLLLICCELMFYFLYI